MTARSQELFADRYLLQQKIGDGRMSSVHLALDTASIDSQVAVKVLDTSHADEIKRESFKRETSALKRLRHPNIVRLLASNWPDDGRPPYLVMEYHPYSLDKYLNGEHRSVLSGFEPYRVMRELAEALTHAHSENVIHRDIKPSNVLLDAEGRPMLTDFGVSKLLSQLTIGETLAGFWSGGYAAPEQRSGAPTGREADMYSLGALYYHLLSGNEPPHEGPTPELVDHLPNLPRPIRNLLKGMLVQDPQQRLSRGSDLLRGLEFTRRQEVVPRHFLVLTRNAVSDVLAAGLSFSDDFRSVAEVLLEDLGGSELDEVYVHRDHRNSEDLIILGDSLRLICAAGEGDALYVKAVQTPYLTNLDREKGRSMQYRAMWEPVVDGFRSGEDANSLTVAADELTNLLARVDTHETVGVVANERQRSRREFIERWNIELAKSRSRIESEATSLKYSAVSDEEDHWRFVLDSAPPDDLDWEDDTPLAVRENLEARPTPAGELIGIRGRIVEVAKQTSPSHRTDRVLPRSGLLTTNRIEALSANSRQSRAVRAFLYEDVANPSLGRVIVDPSVATSIAEPELNFFQDWLSDDQKESVRRAVASNEMFLIKGPPGTGKTSVIAETVLQILKREPEARILLTSQSNVAVDHALTQIASAAGEDCPEMVRLGRAEKIGSGGEMWTLEERARSWREEVLAKCRPQVTSLRSEERKARAAIRDLEPENEHETADAETIEEWVSEARHFAEQLEEYESQLSSLGSEAAGAAKDEVSGMVEQTRSELKDHLDTLNGLLPTPVETQGLSEQETLVAIIREAAPDSQNVTCTDSPEVKELRRIQELRSTLTDWTRVVGLTQDFQELIGESSRVIAATCLFSGKSNPGTNSEGLSFDWAIVDEAGRATVPEVLIPIVKSEKVILVGDERQLPPMLEESIVSDTPASDDEYELDTSLFQALVEQGAESGQKTLSALRTQNRMVPAIGNLISAVFYDGQLENGTETRSRRSAFDWMPAPVTWLSTSRLTNRSEIRVVPSYANVAEAEEVLQLLEKVEEKCRGRRSRPTVAVISGYSAQVEALTTRIDPDNYERWRSIQIEVATVDSFQGRECDVVVYSTVRSNKDGRIGFLRDRRRINVALSRARNLLVIVGDANMMETATIGAELNPFASVLDHIRSNPDECQIVQSGLVRLL